MGGRVPRLTLTGIVVRALGPDDASLLRALRLRALQDAPAAFWATYEEEAAFEPERWVERLRTATTFVAERDGVPIGMVTARPPLDDDPAVALVGMWVDPAARGAAAADLLIAAVIEQARAIGAPRVVLHVVGTNDRADRVYRRNGFSPTGHTYVMDRTGEVVRGLARDV